MPAKKKVKINKNKVVIDPWSLVPNFDDDQNFPLVIEEEDSFGNKKRMFMDYNMKLIPMVDNKENVVINAPSDVISKDHKIMDGEFKLSSPFIVPKKKKSVYFEDENNKRNNHKGSVKAILEYKNMIKPTAIVRRSSFTDKMMFSSPIVKSTSLKENKKMLLEKLQNCKETPILSMEVRADLEINDSLEYIEKNIDTSKLSDESGLSNDANLKESQKRQHYDSSCDLFSDKSSLESKDIKSSCHKSETNSFALPLSVPIKRNVTALEKSFQIINVKDRKRWLQLAKRRSRLIKRRQGLNDSFWKIYQVEDSLSVILKLCQISELQTFAKVFPLNARKTIIKLGEGSFGEVFMLKDKDNNDIVVKFIPVESDQEYNGAPMTTFEDVLSEIVIAKELADLNLGTLNRCKNFVQMSSINSVSVVRGKFPPYFQTPWEISNRIKKSENDNPKLLLGKQQWIVLQFHFAGNPLEDFKLLNWEEAYSILMQVSLSLACAENHMEFEHRDLHLGNVLVLRSEDCLREETYIIDGQPISLQLSGVLATIIDFTFSRINKDGNVVFIDLSKDRDLFLGTGDIQFEVYREMQINNKNDWCIFNPKSNILWLHFLGVKLIEKLNNEDVKNDSFREKFEEFHRKIISFTSVDNLIKEILK